MSYDIISMVDLARPRMRTELLGTFTAPSGSAHSHSQSYRAARHRKDAARLGTQRRPFFHKICTGYFFFLKVWIILFHISPFTNMNR